MNREFKREVDRQRRREEAPERRPEVEPLQPTRRQRTGTRQFLKEVRGELKRVAWPSRKEIASYSVVVIVSVSLITAFIFAIDFAFGQLILRIFG